MLATEGVEAMTKIEHSIRKKSGSYINNAHVNVLTGVFSNFMTIIPFF